MNELYETLEKYFNDLLKGEDGEGVFLAIDIELETNPDGIKYFIERFSREQNPSIKEHLAHVILKHVHDEAAIDFLKKERGQRNSKAIKLYQEVRENVSQNSV